MYKLKYKEKRKKNLARAAWWLRLYSHVGDGLDGVSW
jgi:hypothetical protein